MVKYNVVFFFFQAEDGIRDLVRSRGLGDVYKRQIEDYIANADDIILRAHFVAPVWTDTAVVSTRPDLSLIHI